MNTFWLKVAGIAVGAVVVIILIGTFTGDGDEPKAQEPEKGFYDQVEKDKQEFLTKPQALEPQKQDPPSQPDMPAANQVVAEPVQPVQEPPKPITLYFKELTEIEEVEASRYLNAAVPARSMGRLQIGFKLMVDNCRRVIQRWPESWYAYRAKQMLIDIPERFHARYKITEQEKDLSRFTKPRPGTKPFTDKDSR
ncbi:MAG: hypothetical protein ISS79_13945 [Phycisphaerae bacterium]|nr:hypothetical protein [Phycisphaerae bacterium]